MSRTSHHGYRLRLKALRRHVEKTHAPCWLCGRPIDLTLDPRHPMSFTGDHVQPLAVGGSQTGELKPAHRSCNSRRGKGDRAKTTIKTPATTRQW